ncbi:MAG: cadmium-translocating P-type ATPase [Ruminococcaceae bacterium]|nr:cadmium-translocating P-type ATPase [Oscillospiraceae bacterium]
MSRRQRRTAWRILASSLLLLAAFAAERLLPRDLGTLPTLLLYLPAYLTAGYDVLLAAGRSILSGQVFDEHFLMAIATLGALSIGFLPGGGHEFAEAVFVMVFYQVGELFQSVAVSRSRRSIAALMDIKPETARVLRDGTEQEISPESVAVGETVLVRPGERIPLDGVILEGISDVSTVALTGESLPVSVREGDTVMGGSTNLSGLLMIRALRPFAESSASRILALMEHASAKKSKSERFITRFARYYTPAVVVAAILLAILPPLASGAFSAAFPVWLARALTFLVISCPCALVISVPLSFFGGLGGAARFGVLVKGADSLEMLAGVRTVVFDKTGTLTKGRLAVTRVVALRGDERELLALAASAEASSNHPVALALRDSLPAAVTPATELRELAGRGVIAKVAGEEIAVGNALLMEEAGVVFTPANEIGTVVYVAREGTYLGYILICDQIKESAEASVCALRHVGVTRTVMLTGDRKAVADAVARAVGIDTVHAELLPEEKLTAVEGMLAAHDGSRVAFVGDGMNDAPVLARADVGIAMGALGSDAAIEAADVVLTDDDPTKVARVIRHARRTLSIVRQNIVLALTVKGAVLILSAFGLLGAWQMPFAVFADVGVAVIAILNAMRALKA